ncbi:sensory rhodopsin transducer [Altererythrobacter aurantiacus]|uniref:Sensory rhodopsin transducer n=2 Tax=Parapontixanthobacter aurantiacus TaxID=1463599 RepID=A0A844ZIG0_9SPHN|nr:sensory rhodopsin transducer [Parapontixanthobacter aurantiacus]
MTEIGKRRWAIAEGYIPPGSADPDDPALVSHETACILNTGDEDANVSVTIYCKDREPAGPYRLVVGARRTLHLRFKDLKEPVPRDTDYASVVESDMPIVVQHTRLDCRRSEVALLSTMAFGS